MTIIHIIGKPRQGKGILATFLALKDADRGRKVESNYWLDSPNATKVNFFDMLNFLKKPRVEPTHLLVIDELPGWCDSYVTQAKSNRFATHFLNQSQKLGYDLIFTSQRSMRADINFRELSDVRFRANKDIENKQFVYEVLDVDSLEEDVPTGKKFCIPFTLAATFWNRFNTYEAVPPVGLDEVLVEVQKSDPVLLNRFVDGQVEALLREFPTELPLNISQTNDLLLSIHESTRFSAVVYARLQRRLRETPKQQRQIETPTIQAQKSPVDYKNKWLVAQSNKKIEKN